MNKLRNFIVLLLLLSATTAITSVSAEDWRTVRPDVIYSHKAGLALTYDVVRPTRNPNGAAVLFMVSGGWVSIWAPPETIVRPEQRNLNLFEKIVERGYTLFLVRHGSSPWFKVPEAVADVRLAIRHIRRHAAEYQIDPERIGVCGGSAGGHLALTLGTMGDDGDPDAAVDLEKTSSRVQAVVAWFPPTDLRVYVNHETLSKSFPALVFPDDQAPDVSPLLSVSRRTPPTLLVHGDKDELVPLFHSEKFHEAMQKASAKCELIIMKGAAHGFSGEQGQQAEKALVDWFDTHLPAKATLQTSP